MKAVGEWRLVGGELQLHMSSFTAFYKHETNVMDFILSIPSSLQFNEDPALKQMCEGAR